LLILTLASLLQGKALLANLRFAQLRASLSAHPASAEASPAGQPALDLLVPSSGPFGQILSPPQRLPTDIPLPHFEIIFQKFFFVILDLVIDIPLTGAAGAATGFAQTVPMRDEPAGR